MTRIFALAGIIWIPIFLLVAAAFAAPVNWSDSDYWNVRGDNEFGYCLAQTIYPDSGHSLGIGFRTDGVDVILTGLDLAASPGQTLRTLVSTSDGSSGVWVGKIVSKQTISFDSVDMNSLDALMISDSITFAQIGTFKLDGSYEAIMAAWECQQSIQ